MAVLATTRLAGQGVAGGVAGVASFTNLHNVCLLRLTVLLETFDPGEG